ncbi:MAG: hypothetical protein B6D78_01425 [gamma proteobacterium symbiont of Ctena orbiculata]|nr:MAG: hypothetical protein B6D78_01425 [gamma proteobacterium symbiont of Ctena orbiculata]
MFTKKRLLYLLFALLWIGVTIIGYFGHDAIKSIYEGNASIFNRLIGGQDTIPLSVYYNAFDESYHLLLLLCVFFTLVTPGLYKLLSLESNIKQFDLKDYLLFTFLAIMFLLTASASWQGYVDNNNWRIADWLINYQGGFVRRGLLGEVYFGLWNITGIKPGSFVFITQVLCYFIFYLFTGLLLRRQNNLLAYIVLIISPFIFTYHLHDIQGGFRKEILYLALFSSYVWLMLTTKPGTQKIASILVLLIYPVLVLSHEMLAVFLPYFLMLYFYKSEYFEKKDLFYVSIYVGLSVIAFLLALIYTGSEQHVSEICNSLKEHAAVNCESLGAIAALSESTGYGRDIVQSNIARNDYIWKYLICSLLALIAYIPIANRFSIISSSAAVKMLFLSTVIGTIPLFFVAVDWGRFIYIHLVSLMIVSMASPLAADATGGITAGIKDYIQRINFGNKIIKYSLYMGVVALLFIYALTWHIPHSGHKEIMLHYLF